MPQQQGNIFAMFMPLVLMFGIFYFLLIRPQQKQQKQLQKMLSELKKGDDVVTQGGFLGTVMAVKDTTVVLRIGDGETKVECLKNAITTVRQKA